MGKLREMARARTLIVNEGDRVTYKGTDWFYLHPNEMESVVSRAVALLEKHRKLVRWSKKTPGLVRFR